MQQTGLPPISSSNASVLILGTMPGKASLATQQYYASSTNRFWRTMEHLVKVPQALPYDERVRRLFVAGIALWDVAHTCHRVGSQECSQEPPFSARDVQAMSRQTSRGTATVSQVCVAFGISRQAYYGVRSARCHSSAK